MAISEHAEIPRPRRWDEPFGEMADTDVDALLSRPEFAAIDSERFPPGIPLRGILLYDCRIRTLAAGDVVIREGDYGNSAFFVLEGSLRVVSAPGLPARILGRSQENRLGLVAAIRQLWNNSRFPESRDLGGSVSQKPNLDIQTVNLFDSPSASRVFTGPRNEQTGLPSLSERYASTLSPRGSIVGEIAALSRTQRTATVFAETEATVLEIRWQGLRDISKFDLAWRQYVDQNYREKMLKSMLASSKYFAHLDRVARDEVAREVSFETYGEYEWSHAFKVEESGVGSISEPVISQEGDYANGVLLVGAGFARVSVRMGHGRRTLSYLRSGDIYGYEELLEGWQDSTEVALRTTISALGYLHVLRIPLRVLKQHVFPRSADLHIQSITELTKERTISKDSLLEWAVAKRFINGTRIMLIDQNRCVRCDDCVRACSSTHDGNPRFLRHGETHGKWLVANACMHCTDPVCMIGCPTGAIHRTVSGTVVINDITCIGCTTCANACPYNNIQMVEIRDQKGRPIVDVATRIPVMKATKCDLCASQLGGPACVRACPHDALKRIDFHSDNYLSGEIG